MNPAAAGLMACCEWSHPDNHATRAHTMHTTAARTEEPAVYFMRPPLAANTDDLIIAEALRILEARFTRAGPVFDSPQAVKDYCRLELGGLEHEVFGCMFLDSQHRLIEFRRMFTGTLSQTSVYPREVVKAALACNAGAVIFTHNHPSGSTEPSRADEVLTSTLKSALALVDVRAIDHMVVGATGCTSFAERGLL